MKPPEVSVTSQETQGTNVKQHHENEACKIQMVGNSQDK